jgi:hypothetical protein
MELAKIVDPTQELTTQAKFVGRIVVLKHKNYCPMEHARIVTYILELSSITKFVSQMYVPRFKNF